MYKVHANTIAQSSCITRFNLVSASKTVAILRLNTAVRLNIVKPDDGPTGLSPLVQCPV